MGCCTRKGSLKPLLTLLLAAACAVPALALVVALSPVLAIWLVASSDRRARVESVRAPVARALGASAAWARDAVGSARCRVSGSLFAVSPRLAGLVYRNFAIALAAAAAVLALATHFALGLLIASS
jgi:hypothetical protein